MAELLVAQLVLNGFITVCRTTNSGFDRLSQTISATHTEVERMSGVMESLRQEIEDMDISISKLVNAITIEKCRSRRSEVLNEMRGLHADIRPGILQVALAIQALVEETCVEGICVEVSRIVRDEDKEEQDSFCSSSHKVYFFNNTTAREIVGSVHSLEACNQLFSGVHHVTEDRMVIMINAWAPTEKDFSALVKANGALFAFCQTLCDCINDSRGVYAAAMQDGSIARSRTNHQYNSTSILLSYDWPSPQQLRHFQHILREAKTGNQDAANQISEALERKGEKQQTKNVYLIGQTGEGKSTLANALTGTDNFPVSFAGTGTYAISGCLVQREGALDCDQRIMVWDTPGMNDQDDMDKIFESKMYSHLNREQTVSTIFIVSKDGSRFPGTVKEMIRVYKKAFGESLLNCLAVLIGIRLEEASEAALKAKRTLWVKKVSQEIGHRLSRDRVYFYDARVSEPQEELLRIRKMIDESDIFLTGTGRTIYQGILELRNESNADTRREKKERMQVASNEIIEGVHEEVLLHPRVKFDFDEKAGSIGLQLLQSRRSIMIKMVAKTLQDGFAALGIRSTGLPKGNQSDNSATDIESCKKQYTFTYAGRGAKKTLEAVGFPMMGAADKDRFNAMIRQTRKYGLIMTKMESETIGEEDQRVEKCNYMLVDIEDSLNGAVYSRIEAIIGQLVSDRHVAEPIIAEIGITASGG